MLLSYERRKKGEKVRVVGRESYSFRGLVGR